MDSRKGGGAKLNRTEIVYVRLDPKVHQGAQLASSRERRTLSSFIECAVEERLKVISSGTEGISVWKVMEEIWHPEPAVRFSNLAFRYPHLLSHSELRTWEIVNNRPIFWLGVFDAHSGWCWQCTPETLIVDRLIEQWPTLARIQSGELDESALPRVGHEPSPDASEYSGRSRAQPRFGGEPAPEPNPLNLPEAGGRQSSPRSSSQPPGHLVHVRTFRGGGDSPAPESSNKRKTRRKA